MDGFDEIVNNKVIMATYIPDTIDSVLLRSDRLDTKIDQPNSDHRQRRPNKQNIKSKMVLNEDDNLKDFVISKEQNSFADIPFLSSHY